MIASEPIALRARDGSIAAGQARVKHWSRSVRYGRAAAIATVGVVMGALTIVVPVLHLVSTWLIPCVGLVLALFVLRMRSQVEEIEGSCPKCQATVRGGPFGAVSHDEPLWVRCPACTVPMEVQWP